MKKVMKAKKQKNIKINLGLKPLILLWLIFLLIPILAYQLLYFDKISPGIFIDGINVGGLSVNEATNYISREFFLPSSINFNYQNLKSDQFFPF